MAKSTKKKPKKRKKAGRPTSYKKAYCAKLIAYFDVEPYEDWEIPHYKQVKGKKMVAWTDYKRMPNKLPTLRGFAKSIKVGVSTVYRWIDEKPEFRDAFTHAQEIRKWILIQNGLQGLYNPLFAKFTAINVTDMKDKTETEHTGKVSLAVAIAEAVKWKKDRDAQRKPKP